MYTREDEVQARCLWQKRLRLTLLPLVLGLAVGIALFVLGRMQRSDTLWMATAALTILGGGVFLFLYGVWAKPAHDYLRHVELMLHGRKRETVGVLTSFSPELCERDGSGEEEDDRLFYYDDEKPAPEMPIGSRVRVESNDKMVSGIWRA